MGGTGAAEAAKQERGFVIMNLSWIYQEFVISSLFSGISYQQFVIRSLVQAGPEHRSLKDPVGLITSPPTPKGKFPQL